MKTAHDTYDFDKLSDQQTDDEYYCERHDLFKVQNTMGDFVCVACKVLASQRSEDGVQGLLTGGPKP